MKNLKNLFIIFVIAILLQIDIYGQISKPQYLVRAERADTVLGEFTIELFPGIAPLHSAYFDSLVNISFYDSTAFHRVIPDFVVQGGDPNSKDKPRDTWGWGDSSQATILAEFSGVSHQRGIIGAARDEDINSASSQFYINVADNRSLDWLYTAFGQVLSGMEVVDFIVNVPRDAQDNPDEKIEMFITKTNDSTDEVPGIPNLIKPTNNAVGLLELDSLAWEKIDGAVQYHLQISKAENFDSLYLDMPVGFDLFRLPDLDLGNIQYWWRVKSDNGGNVSEFSNVRTFYSSIEAPILIYPEMNDDSITIQPTFTWHPVSGATGYRFQLNSAPNFAENRMLIDTDTITTNSFTPPPLQPNKSHYWQVYSLTDEYQGPKSEFRRFVTPDVTGVVKADMLPTDFVLYQNYPNPFNPITTIYYDLPEQGFVKLTVFDFLGRQVKSLINEEQSAGSYNVNFDGSDLASGVYYYSLESGNFKQTLKMMLIK
jgi:peptidyl-prolyl cis-trans isomerase B (cyclophilin B)